MKLYEAGAVLLIIGSAVVGPIGGQRITPLSQIAVEQACLRDLVSHPEKGAYGPTCMGPPGILETTAETCARAMKEIGASPSVTTEDGPHAWEIRKINRKGKPFMVSVLCIPAPTGLRR